MGVTSGVLGFMILMGSYFLIFEKGNETNAAIITVIFSTLLLSVIWGSFIYFKVIKTRQNSRDDFLMALQGLSYEEMSKILFDHNEKLGFFGIISEPRLSKAALSKFSPYPLGLTMGSLTNNIQDAKERGGIICLIINELIYYYHGTFDGSKDMDKFCEGMQFRHKKPVEVNITGKMEVVDISELLIKLLRINSDKIAMKLKRIREEKNTEIEKDQRDKKIKSGLKACNIDPKI